MKNFKFFEIFLMLYFTKAALFSFDLNPKFIKYIHNEWGLEEGLPNNFILSIAQSNEGFILIGTQEGLSKFDGQNFILFNKKNKPQLKENIIQIVFVDKENNIWLGTNKGLYKMKNWEIFPFPINEAFDNSLITCIVEDNESKIWVGSFNSGMARISEDKINLYSIKEGLPGNDISALEIGLDNSLWIGTYENGLRIYKNNFFYPLPFFEKNKILGITSICRVKNEKIVIGTRNGEIFFFGKGNLEDLKPEKIINLGTSVLLKSDIRGNIWAGTGGKGLYKISYEKETIDYVPLGQNLSEIFISSIYEDLEGAIWIGTLGEGLHRISSAPVLSLTRDDGLSHNNVFAIYEDKKSNILAGTTGGGLNLFDGNSFKKLLVSDKIKNDIILSISEDKKGNLVLGTHYNGLLYLKKEKILNFNEKKGLISSRISSIFSDSKGNIWVGTLKGGLYKLEGENLKAYFFNCEKSTDFVKDIAEDKNGNLWMAIKCGGIFCLKENGSFEVLNEKNGLNSKEVTSIYFDKENTLWVGTYGDGLFIYKEKSFYNLTTRDGLLEDIVYKIIEDDFGNLWLSGNKGISKIIKKEILDYISKKTNTFFVRIYDEEDGMASRECNGGVQNAGCKTKDGKIWFPTTKGIVMVDPEKLLSNKYIPPVILEKILVDQKEIFLDERIIIGPGTRNLEFHFTSPTFISHKKLNFFYKLDGFDKEWINCGLRRVAYYSKIPPGKYLFEVKMRNQDGNWSYLSNPAKIYVKPYFYQTFWFYFIACIALFLVLLVLHRIRVSFLLTKSLLLEEKNRLAREIHDNLAQSLSGIKLQLQAALMKLKIDPKSSYEHIEKALILSQKSLSEASRTLWALNPKKLDKINLEEALRDMLNNTIGNSFIKYDFNVQGKAVNLKPEIELNILRIAQEAIANTIKHSNAKNICISLIYGKKHLTLKIKDDGIGFDHNLAILKPNSFGLKNMEIRAKEIKAKLNINSFKEKGTEISIIVPIKLKVWKKIWNKK